MERARVIYTTEEIRTGVLKEIVPAPGTGKIIVPLFMVRKWSNSSGSLFSNNGMRIAYNTCYPSSGFSMALIPSLESARFARTQYFTNSLVSVDSGGAQLSPINAPISMCPNTGITGGSDELEFDLFYVVNDLS